MRSLYLTTELAIAVTYLYVINHTISLREITQRKRSRSPLVAHRVTNSKGEIADIRKRDREWLIFYLERATAKSEFVLVGINFKLSVERSQNTHL
jgi:hypothetical protein